MTNQIKQSEVNNAAWSACDTLRSVMDASNYKDYILVMLFLKYISDTWNYKESKLRKEFGHDPYNLSIQLAIEEQASFKIPAGQNFYDLFTRREESNIGDLINTALNKIAEANRKKLDGVFRNIDFNSEANFGRTKDRNRLLKMLLEDFHKPELDLSPNRVGEDIIGECYIYLISRFASDAGKKAGEFYTPKQVSRLLAKLAMPKPGDTICDPACGSGSLLICAAEEVGDDNYALYGQESIGSTWALAQMNMFLHSKDGATSIKWCDTLNSPALIENDKLMKFDVIVANPPFSLDKWGHENAKHDHYNRFWRGIPPRTKGDYAFISHMIETAKRFTGRVAVVVPHGVLFRGGTEGIIRQKLIEENLLDSVIGLPANLFTSTGIPVTIMVFDRSREVGGVNEGRRDVMFIDAAKEFKPGKAQNFLEDGHIERIVEAYKARKTVDKYAYLASVDEIKGNGYNLNIPRYVDTFKADDEIDIGALQKEIKALEAEMVEVRAKMDGYLKELGVGNKSDEVKDGQ